METLKINQLNIKVCLDVVVVYAALQHDLHKYIKIYYNGSVL